MTARPCCDPTCIDEEAGKTRVPLCSRHARMVYQDVADLMANATTAQRVASAGPPKVVARPQRGRTMGVVYFVLVGELLKIGFSTKPKTRYRDLGASMVFGSIPGTMEDEKAMLARFGPWWERGEYFRPEPECLAMVREVLSVPA